MKNLKYYLCSLVLAGGLASCDSLLDEKPLYSQNSSVVFSSASNAELALLGCYAYMSTNNGYGQMWQEVPISASGLAFAQHNASDQDVNANLSTPVSNALVSYAWDGMYKVIAEVNAFLESLNASGIGEDMKTQYSGEAKFLRAVAYYNLATTFGDVPLKTVASSSEGIAIARSSKEDVYAQVVADLKDAIAMPETKVDGRANAWAAKAYLGKVYHKMARLGIDSQANYELAKAMFDDVYANGGYALEPKFGNLFVDNVRGSKESIFQLNFSTESTVCFNRASNRFSPSHSTTGVAWSTYRASKASYDLMEGTYPGDPRIAESFLTEYRARQNNQPNPKAQVGDVLSVNDSVYLYPYFTYSVTGDSISKNGKNVALRLYRCCLPYAELNDPKNPGVEELANFQTTHGESYYNKEITKVVKNIFAMNGRQESWPGFKKIFDEYQVAQRSHKNVIVYRYAEMLLLMADVYNELGNSQKAVSLANEVLARARKSGKTASAEPKDWSASLSKEQVTEKLYFERLFEFIGEPNMYEMVRICGTEYMKKLLSYQNNHEITKASQALYATTNNAWLDQLFNNGTLTEEFLKKNLLLPIPQSEIDANSSISSTDNNFGY